MTAALTIHRTELRSETTGFRSDIDEASERRVMSEHSMWQTSVREIESRSRNGQRDVAACGASADGESAALHCSRRGNQVAFP
jgi:hypothetical protein